MLVGGPSARAFGLRGGIPMAAAQTSVYRAPASRGDITRSIQMHISAGRRVPLQNSKFQSALDAQR